MIKDIISSLPVLLISIVATITGGTAVSKIAQELKPTLSSDNREVQEVRTAATTPSPLDDAGNTDSGIGIQPTDSVTPTLPLVTTSPKPTTTKVATANTFTLATLAQHNKSGNCYVAYNGIVYSVSTHPSWQNCSHHGTSGGRDITSIFPHSTSYFSTLPKVGTLTGGSTTNSGTGTSSGRKGDDDNGNEHDEDENEIEFERD